MSMGEARYGRLMLFYTLVCFLYVPTCASFALVELKSLWVGLEFKQRVVRKKREQEKDLKRENHKMEKRMRFVHSQGVMVMAMNVLEI